MNAAQTGRQKINFKKIHLHGVTGRFIVSL